MALSPKTKTRLYNTGHFALETRALEIADAIRDFIGRKVLQLRLPQARSRRQRVQEALRKADIMSRQEVPMGVFTEGEISYLGSSRLGRLATVGRGGTPHVTPVGFSYNVKLVTVDLGGRDLANTKKFRDVARSSRAALVVDDVRPPWRPRGIEVRGRAEAVDGSRPMIRIYPERIVSWGINTDGYRRNSRSVGAAR